MGADRPRILLVSGDEDLRSSLDRLLKRAGYQVNSVAKKSEAFRHVQEESYDLIFLDLLMSDIRELEFISDIKNHRSDVGIFILSGANDTEAEVKALQAGAAGYLNKPVEPSEIIRDINKMLKSHLEDDGNVE